MKISTRVYAQPILLSSLMLLVLTPMAGCTSFLTSAAQERVKTLKLPSSRAQGFADCLESDGGICPAADAQPSVTDLLSDRGTPRTQPLSTDTAKPRFTLIDSNGKARSLGDVQAEFGQSADAQRLAAGQLEKLLSGAAAADQAAKVLMSDTQKKLNEIFNIARHAPTADAAAKRLVDANGVLDIDIDEFNQYLDDVEEVTSAGGWDALNDQAAFSDASPEDIRRRAYIAAYFKAYFRNGKFYQATIDGSEVKKDLVTKLKEAIPGVKPEPGGEDPYEKLATKLFEGIKFDSQGQLVLGKLNSDGLVTRGGQQLKFPSVEAELSLSTGKVETTKIDYIAVGSDLIRVLLHAIYDAHDRIPGVSNATGYTLGANALGENKPDITHVDATDFGAIELRSTQIEAAASAGIGRLVRGLGWVSLNNEALATAVETAVGVAVRKHSEKVMWCWYACELDKKTPLADYAPLGSQGQVSVAVKFSADPQAFSAKSTSSR